MKRAIALLEKHNLLKIISDELDINLERGNATESAYHSLLIFNYSDIENTTRIANKLEQFYNDAGINMQKTLTFEHRFQKHLNSVYTFI